MIHVNLVNWFNYSFNIHTTDAEKRSNRWKDKRRFTPVTPYLELFAFFDLIQDASNRIRPLRYPHEHAFLKTNWSVLELLVLTNQERIFELSERFCFSKDARRKTNLGDSQNYLIRNPGEYNLFIDSKIRVSLTKILFGKTTIYIYIYYLFK